MTQSQKPEVEIPWFNASNANDQSCFDVQRLTDGTIQTRNSTNPGVVIDYTPKEWAAMIKGVKEGKFDHTV